MIMILILLFQVLVCSARPTITSRVRPQIQTRLARAAINTAAPVNVPRHCPPRASVVDYGPTQSDKGQIYRDGGGGVTIDGNHLMVFSDSFTTTGSPADPLTGFVANTFAYALNDTHLSDFGDGLKTQVGLYQNETGLSKGRYAVWPSQSLVKDNLDGQEVAYGLMPVVYNPSFGDLSLMYNTLVQVSLTPDGPSATRVVQAMFYANEPQYGSFAMVKADGYTYLYANDVTGIKVARTKNVQDRSQYEYLSQGWSASIPTLNDASINVFNYTITPFGAEVGIYSGEIFFSIYHNTYLMVFMDGFVDGLFRVSYALTSQPIGPWSDPVDLYQTPDTNNQGWNYAGHAYPDRDETGGSLLVSYTYAFNYINTAKLTWLQ